MIFTIKVKVIEKFLRRKRNNHSFTLLISRLGIKIVWKSQSCCKKNTVKTYFFCRGKFSAKRSRIINRISLAHQDKRIRE